VKTVECPFEQDVLDGLAAGRGPDEDATLAGHVAGCRICSDIVDVALALLGERDDVHLEAQIPSSAVMWWRAQMRARQEAAREAARPIAVAQIVASVALVVLAAVLATTLSPWLRGWAPGSAGSLTSEFLTVDLPAVLLANGWLLPALIACIWMVLAPLAIYFVVAED
jgi:hypothetical protein